MCANSGPRLRGVLPSVLALTLLLACAASPVDSAIEVPSHAASPFFGISVRDFETGNGVPLVLLRTGNYLEHYTDSAGNVAFLEPGMMDQAVWFSVLADGYVHDNNTFPADGKTPYDNGTMLVTTPGVRVYLYVHRTQAAQRMYRLTGGGLYRDTVLLGLQNELPRSARQNALADPRTGSFG